MTTREVQEARRLRAQSEALRRRAGAEGRRLGEVVAQLLETRKAIQRARVLIRSETAAGDDAWSSWRSARAGPPADRPSRPDWIDRFTAHLHGLGCGLDAAEAATVAQDAWPSFCLVAPETAARSMAAILNTLRRPVR